MANKNSIYIGALTSFILDTKPYHSKLTEVQETYQFAESMTVHVGERLYMPLIMKSAWAYSFFSDGVSEVSPGIGKPMTLHQLVSPVSRIPVSNNDVNSRGAFKVRRDENTDLPLVPFAFDPKCLQGAGLSDAFVQRLGHRAFNEPLLEGHDVFLSKGAYVVAIKQTVSTQPIILGHFSDTYEVTDGPFPLTVSLPFTNADGLIITGPAVQSTLSSIVVSGPGVVAVFGVSGAPNYLATITERQKENLITDATVSIQTKANNIANPASAVNQVKNLLQLVSAQLTSYPNATATTALNALMSILSAPALPGSYEDLLSALVNGGTPVIAGYTGWVGQDTTFPFTDVYVDDILAALSPAMYFNKYTDTDMRESGVLAYRNLHQGALSVTNIVADPICQVYEEWTLTSLDASTLIIRGSSSGTLGVVTAGSSFHSVQLAFNTSASGALSVGEVFYLTPSAKLTVHYQAPLETWSLIRTNPLAYSRPILNSARYGFIRSQTLVSNSITVLSNVESTTIVLEAISSTVFRLSSTSDPLYTGNVTVNVPFNDSVLAFTIVAGTAYSYTVGDKYFVEILKDLPIAEDLDLYYGYDLDPYDAETMVYNNVSNLFTNFLDQLGFGYGSRFTGYNLSTFGLTLGGGAVNDRQWRLRALPDISQPLLLSAASPSNKVNVIATDDPLNPFAVAQFDMVDNVTNEGPQSATDPDIVGDLKLWYSTSFALEYQNAGTWVYVDTISVGVPYTNQTHGLSFTIVAGSKPFISGELTSSWFPSTAGPFSTETVISGDTIAWTVRNPSSIQTEQVSLSSNKVARLIMYGEGFHGAPPATWSLTWTGVSTYKIDGVFTDGPMNGRAVTPLPILVNTSTDGFSYKNPELHLHFTVIPGIAGLRPNDVFTFKTYARQPTFLVYGSLSGWQNNAALDEWYWNGKIGFKIPSSRFHVFDAVSMHKVAGDSPWATSIGAVTLNYLRPDTLPATYVAQSHTNGHWALYRNGKVVADGATILADEFINVTMPAGALGDKLIFSIEGHDYDLCIGNDLAVVRASAGRAPTANDFVILERTESDTLQVSIKAKDPAHQLVLNELYPQVTDLRFVDHSANSGVPLTNTSPETAILTGWLPILETRFDIASSIAEFSDATTHVTIRAAATGEVLGSVESLSSNPVEPVVFRWEPAFHTKYLPLNTEATVVTLGSDMDEHSNVNMSDSVLFLLTGGLESNMLFSELISVQVSDAAQFTNGLQFLDTASVVIIDSPFGGFLPGYDNTQFDLEDGIDGFYDAGVSLSEHFIHAQSLALLSSMTPQQQALYDDLYSQIQPYLDNGNIITTTLAEFLTNINAANPSNWTASTNGFGIPAVGLGVSVEESNTSTTASASISEAMTIIITDTNPAETTAMFTVTGPIPVNGLPPAQTLYGDFYSPLTVSSPGARVIEVSFSTAQVLAPTIYFWRPLDAAPLLVPVLTRLDDHTFRFSLGAASELKLIVI